MNEREYIDATNLAKIRTAKNIIRDLLPMNDAEKDQERRALVALSEWEDELNKRVKTHG